MCVNTLESKRKNNIVNIQQFVLLSVIFSVHLLREEISFRGIPRRTHPLQRLNKVEGGNFICKSEKSLSNDPLLFSNISFNGKYKTGFTNAARIITQRVIGRRENDFECYLWLCHNKSVQKCC